MSSLTGATGRSPGNSMTGGNKIPQGHELGKIGQFTPEQTQLFQRLFSQVDPGSQLSRLAGGDQSQFAQMEAPAMRQFQELQGGLASRFSGMGTGARRSSGFQNVSSQASQDFASQLQSNRMSLQRQAIQDLMGISNDLLSQRPYEQFLIEKQQEQPGWQKFLGGALPIAGAVAGGVFGPMMGIDPITGAKIGGSVGSSAGQAFLR